MKKKKRKKERIIRERKKGTTKLLWLNLKLYLGLLEKRFAFEEGNEKTSINFVEEVLFLLG